MPGGVDVGQDRWTIQAAHTLRRTTTATSSRAKTAQESWNTEIHRMSWNRSRGAGAVTCAAIPALPASNPRRSAASTTGAATAGIRSPVRPKNPVL